eukprot:4966648-Pyramimonas_sp.AAC.1
MAELADVGVNHSSGEASMRGTPRALCTRRIASGRSAASALLRAASTTPPSGSNGNDRFDDTSFWKVRRASVTQKARKCDARPVSTQRLRDGESASADLRGYGVDVRGHRVDVRGYGVDVRGHSVDVRGYGVDVRGVSNCVDVPLVMPDHLPTSSLVCNASITGACFEARIKVPLKASESNRRLQ